MVLHSAEDTRVAVWNIEDIKADDDRHNAKKVPRIVSDNKSRDGTEIETQGLPSGLP